MSDVEVRTGVGDVEDAPVGPRDAEGCEARARVLLGGDARVEAGWGASTWLALLLLEPVGREVPPVPEE